MPEQPTRLSDDQLDQLLADHAIGPYEQAQYDPRLVAVVAELRSLRSAAAADAEKLVCGHPACCIGKVDEHNPNEEPHCLWCGDIQDLSTVLNNLAEVYSHITNGRVSKPMTLPSVVKAIADSCEAERIQQAVDDALSETRESQAVDVERLAGEIADGLLLGNDCLRVLDANGKGQGTWTRKWLVRELDRRLRQHLPAQQAEQKA